MSKILAYLIRLIHIAIVLFIALTPYLTNDPDTLMIHIATSLTLVAHWAMKSNVCSLTLLESQLRGIPMDKSFMHQIISPVYDISDSTLSSLSWLVTLVNMTVSGNKLMQMAKVGVYPQALTYFV